MSLDKHIYTRNLCFLFAKNTYENQGVVTDLAHALVGPRAGGADVAEHLGSAPANSYGLGGLRRARVAT